jgi:hypothetical protein
MRPYAGRALLRRLVALRGGELAVAAGDEAGDP